MLSERSRSQIFRGLGPIVGEEAVGEMLAHYPAAEGEQAVTKDHLDARFADLRVEMAELRVELHQQTKQLLIWIPTAMAGISGAIAILARVGT